MKLGELFLALGFDVDDKKLKTFREDVRGAFGDMLKLSAAAGAGVYAINKFLKGSIDSAVALRNFNVQTGDSVEALQRWQIAATMSNTALSVDEVTSSIQALQQAIGDVSMGKGAGPFAMLGIDVRGKDAYAVLEEMRGKFQQNVARWGKTQTVDLMSQTGINPGMLNALMLGRGEFDRLAVSVDVLDKDSREKLVRLGEAINQFALNFKLFKDQAAADWSGDLIKAINTVIPLLNDAKTAFADIYDLTGKLGDPARAALIATAFTVMFFPLVRTAAVITAIVAGLQDIDHYANGKKSAIGDAADYWAQSFIQTFGLGPKPVDPNMVPRRRPTGPIPGDAPLPGPGAMTYQDLMANISTITQTQIALASMRGSVAGLSNSQVNVTTTNHIHSFSDPNEIADEIISRQQKTLNGAFAQTNNGVRW